MISEYWRKTMKNLCGFTTLIIIWLGLGLGCTKQPTRVDAFYGTAYELAKVTQISNLDAGIHTGPPTGLEGPVAAKVIDRYQKGFEAPAAKTESYSITVGGMTKK